MSSPGLAVETRGSFEIFFDCYAREVAAIVALTTGDVALAEDATQEAMARAHAAWPRLAALDRPDLWVIRVATNTAIDAWRKRRRETQLTADSVAAPRDEITALWVRWGMEQLTPEDRLLLILRHRDQLSIEEISASLHWSPHTVTRHLKRARRRLRAILSEDRDE